MSHSIPLVVLSVSWIATVYSNSYVSTAIAPQNVLDRNAEISLRDGSDPFLGSITPAAVCTIQELSQGFYFGELDPIAYLELNVHSEKFLSMVFFFGSDDTRVLFRSNALEYEFDPSDCRLSFVAGSGDVHFFGGQSKTFSEPKEIAGILSEIIPPDAPVNLGQELSGTVEENGIMVMGVFWLKRENSGQDWLSIMERNSEDEDWSMTPKDHSFLASVAMMVRESSTLHVQHTVIFFAVIFLLF
jgi:hypothetical protein